MKAAAISIRGLIITEIALILSYLSLTRVQMDGFANDPGVGWHLASGDFVLKNFSVPKFDPFLASYSPLPWVSDQWGGDTILSSLYNLAGYPLVYAALTVIFLSTFFWINLRTQVFLTGSAISSVAATLFAFKIAQIHFILRPVVFGFFFF